MIINAVSAIVASLYSFDQVQGWMGVFPSINFINSIMLVVLLRLDIIGKDCIGDDDAPLVSVLITLVVVIVVYFLCSRYFKLNWAMTFSASVCYATNLNRHVLNMFVK